MKEIIITALFFVSLVLAWLIAPHKLIERSSKQTAPPKVTYKKPEVKHSIKKTTQAKPTKDIRPIIIKRALPRSAEDILLELKSLYYYTSSNMRSYKSSIYFSSCTEEELIALLEASDRPNPSRHVDVVLAYEALAKKAPLAALELIGKMNDAHYKKINKNTGSEYFGGGLDQNFILASVAPTIYSQLEKQGTEFVLNEFNKYPNLYAGKVYKEMFKKLSPNEAEQYLAETSDKNKYEAVQGVLTNLVDDDGYKNLLSKLGSDSNKETFSSVLYNWAGTSLDSAIDWSNRHLEDKDLDSAQKQIYYNWKTKEPVKAVEWFVESSRDKEAAYYSVLSSSRTNEELSRWLDKQPYSDAKDKGYQRYAVSWGKTKIHLVNKINNQSIKKETISTIYKNIKRNLGAEKAQSLLKTQLNLGDDYFN